MIVCIDTSALIWAGQAHGEAPTPGQINSYSSLEYCESVGAMVVLPAPVVTEYLTWYKNPVERAERFNLLSSTYNIMPFNDHAALLAAGLWDDWCNKHGHGPQKEIKVRCKFDFQIAAIAEVNQCEHLLTGNPRHFAPLTKCYTVIDLNAQSLGQQPLFDGE